MPTSKSVSSDMFVAGLELDLLSGVLSRVSECVRKELAAIDKRATTFDPLELPALTENEPLEEGGSVPDEVDFEAAADIPLAWIELTSRAVAYELVAIVEHRLHAFASVPWNASKNTKGHVRADSPFLSEAWAASMAQLKQVSKGDFSRDIRPLIEQHYGFSFSDLDGWSEFKELRRIVNSLKHRRGEKEWKELFGTTDWREKNLLERDDMDEEKARQAIQNVRRFLIALEDAVNRSTAAKS